MAKKKISYSEAVTEIEKIMHEIENEDPDVDVLSNKVKRAAELISSCKQKLSKTEHEIEEILKDIAD